MCYSFKYFRELFFLLCPLSLSYQTSASFTDEDTAVDHAIGLRRCEPHLRVSALWIHWHKELLRAWKFTASPLPHFHFYWRSSLWSTPCFILNAFKNEIQGRGMMGKKKGKKYNGLWWWIKHDLVLGTLYGSNTWWRCSSSTSVKNT